MTYQPQTFNKGLGIFYDVEKELQDLKEDLKSGECNNTTNHTTKKNDNDSESYSDTVEKIELICNQFHQVVRQMRSRYANRSTLEIKDEYDVQDLFHCQLISHGFDNIRREEPVPSESGAGGRIDFLLKSEQIGIEIKKARQNYKDRDIGEDLGKAILRYRAHPDCKALICFVYDPGENIGNPSALKSDLESISEKITVKVLIRS